MSDLAGERQIRQCRQAHSDRKQKKKSKETIRRSLGKVTQQQKITAYAIRKYELDPGAGDRITDNKQISNIRIYLQNLKGVMGKDTKLNDRRVLLSLREWDVDVV